MNDIDRDRFLFREVQRIRQVWVLAIVALLAAVAWWSFILQIVLGRPFGTNPGPDWLIWLVFVLCGFGVPALLFLARLVVEVEPGGLRLHYVPFRNRWIPREDLRAVEVVEYRPLRDWGGWGIRWWPGRGWAYTASGNHGVKLRLAGGRTLLVGSTRPEELADALTSLAHGN